MQACVYLYLHLSYTLCVQKYIFISYHSKILVKTILILYSFYYKNCKKYNIEIYDSPRTPYCCGVSLASPSGPPGTDDISDARSLM